MNPRSIVLLIGLSAAVRLGGQPTVLTLGGQGFDAGYAMAADSAGNVYIAGDSDSQSFSTGGRRASRDSFAAKLDPSGRIVYLTWLSGSGAENVRAIAVDAVGNAYVAGYTTSTDFVTTPGAISSRNAGFEDAFVVKLNSAGTMVYSTLLGSAGSDQALGVAVDPSGNIYVTGQTSGSFPTTPGVLQPVARGATDCFVSKINPNTGTLVYSTLLGGGAFDACRGIAVDSVGNAYVAGVTYSPDFPVQTALQTGVKGSGDAFVAKINPSGTALVYSTFLGGDGFDEANAITVDASGSAYIAGDTTSWNFPVSSYAAQSKLAGGYDAFVARVSVAGTSLIYATLIGGGGSDSATAIALDRAGRAVVAGFTNSVDLPVVPAAQNSFTGGMDAFAAVVDVYGSSLLFSSYIGGSGDDRAYGVAATPIGHVYTTGYTQSPDFPAAAAVAAGNSDIFLAEWTGTWQDPPLTLSVGPLNATITPNQTQQFVAASIAGVTWSISPNVGSINTQGVYTPPSTVAGPMTIVVTATSTADPNVSSSVAIVLRPAAQFIKLDTSTQGTWKGVYGSDGYNAIGNAVAYPPYVMVTSTGNSSYVWSPNTADARAPQQASGGQRTAGVWYAPDQFVTDLLFTDGQVHQLAVYCLDWDYLGRSQTVEILDANGAVADSRTISNFGGGVWIAWNVGGHVQLRVKRLGGSNAVLSGLFLGPLTNVPVTVSVTPASAILSPNQTQLLTAAVANAGNTAVIWSIAPAIGTIDGGGLYTAPAKIATQQVVTATAISQADRTAQGSATLVLSPPGSVPLVRFVKLDTATQGSWKGVYGADGYNIVNGAVNYPGYTNPVPSGASSYTWAAGTSDVRALQLPSGTQRVAGVWYTADKMTVDVPVTDGQTHQFAVYCLDWDNIGRSETIEILDAAGTVLDTRPIAKFGNGIWVVWNIAGHVQLRVSRPAGLNAVLTGLFLDPVKPVQFVKIDTATQGSWKGVYGANGYNVVNGGVSYPQYVNPAVSGNASYTWAATTTDPRAPQQPGSAQRIAGVWYAAGRFTIDLPFNDTQTHQIAVYCLDWDYIGRTQTLEIVDANGIVLDTRAVSNFGGGAWVVWTVAGHVQLRVTQTGAGNSVVSALLFDPAGS